MEFIKQYIKIINYALMGLVFGFSCFYLLANGYHYLEIRKDHYVNLDTQPLIQEIEKKLDNINKNIASFNTNAYSGNIPNNKMMVISQNLKSCVSSFYNDTYKEVRNKNQISIVDVYNLRESYETDVLNTCIVTNLYWTTTITPDNFNSNYLNNNVGLIKLHINSLLNETTYLKKDLLNNSSYFFNTSIASSSIKDNTKDGFYEVMSSYNQAASFVEYMSEWFKNEVEGNYD